MSGNCIHDSHRFDDGYRGVYCGHVCIGAECPRHPDYDLPLNVSLRAEQRRLYIRSCSDEELINEIKRRLNKK